MEQGRHTFFIIERKLVGLSEFLQPQGPVKKIIDESWVPCGETFAFAGCPWKPSNNMMMSKYEYEDKQATDEWRVCRQSTGEFGFFDYDTALRVLERLVRGSEKGLFDYKDSYGKKEQAVRYKFRICRVNLTYFREVAEVYPESSKIKEKR